MTGIYITRQVSSFLFNISQKCCLQELPLCEVYAYLSLYSFFLAHCGVPSHKMLIIAP